MKKKLIPILCLMLLFCLSACSTKETPNFEYDKSIMIDTTKSIVTNYHNVTGATAEYLKSDGDEVEKGAVKGFEQAQTTDNVGTFVGFDTSDDVVTFENGSKGDVLCSIIAKFENRDVRVTVSYEENKLFNARYEQELQQLDYYASMSGYTSTDEYVQKDEYISQMGFSTESAKAFLTEYIMSSQSSSPVIPYNPIEVEVSAVYSTSELLLNGAKNMGVGMGVVFCVLIFIALIIYLLRFVPKLLGKEIKKPGAPKTAKPVKETPKAAPIPTGPIGVSQAARTEGVKETAAAAEEVTDGELIAVITAALQAYLSESAAAAGPVHPPAYTASNDTLVVRSIRRVR